MNDFSDQRVIVTGGTRGIGRAIVTAFLERGAQVIATYVGGEAQAAELAALHASTGRLSLSRFDVSDYAEVERFFGGLEGPPTVLVNNAGIRRDAIVGMLKVEDWKRVLAVNLDGSFYMAKHAVMAMSRQRYGRIINITSPSAELGIKGQAAYAASKAGQVALARALSKEVASRNITVNNVEPGFIETELLEGLDQKALEEYRKMVPQNRFGTAAEVAASVLFLASKDASYITGATLRVAGGL